MANASSWFARTLVVALALAPLASAGCATRPGVDDGNGSSIGPGGSGSPDNSCTVEGDRQPCHIEVGRQGKVVTCVDGEKWCYGKQWSQCQRAEGDLHLRSVALPDLNGGGLSFLANAPNGSTCTSDPCDPNCQTSQVNGPFNADPNSPPTVVGVSGGVMASSNIPGNCSSKNGGMTAYSCSGFKAKTTDPDGVCSECTDRNVPKNGTVTQQQCQSACQSDQYCTGDGTDSCTTHQAQDDNWECSTKGDVTTPLACDDGSGQAIISVCNRGGVDLPAGIECCQFPGNSPHFADDLSGTSTSCAGGTLLGTTTAVIKPHFCEQVKINPSGNTSSIICNPHYNQSTTTVTAGPLSPSSPSGSSGGWTTLQNIWDGTTSTNATAVLGQQTATSAFTASNATAGTWNSIANAQGTTADNAYMTTDVSGGAATIDAYHLPTTGVAVSPVGWSNPLNATSDADGNAVASAPTDGVQTLVATSASTSGLTNTAGTGGFVGWRNVGSATGTTPTNLYDGVSGTFAETLPGKSAQSGIMFKGYTGLPPGTATSLSLAVTWKADSTAGDCTARFWLVDYSSGSNVLGAGTYLYNAKFRPAAANTSQTDTIALSAAQLASVNASANFLAVPQVEMDVVCPNGNPTLQTIRVDSLNLLTKYPLVDNFGNFNIRASEGGSLPVGATVTQIDYSAKYRMTGATTTSSYVSFAPYISSAPATGTTTKTFLNNPAGTVPNALTTVTWSDTGLSLTDSQFANSRFTMRVTAAGGGTAELESLQVRVRYVNGTSNTITLSSFGLNIPTGATVTSVVANTRWMTNTAGTGTLGVQLYNGSTALGTETTANPPTTTATSVTNIYSGTITPADVNSNITVRLRASGTGTAFTASFDYVSVTVTYVITSATVDLTGFAFAIPTTASITGMTLSMSEKTSSSAPTVDIKAEAFRSGSVANGAVAEATTGSTSYATKTGTATGALLGTPADYNSGFFVRLTATTPSTTTVNFNALIDSLTATVTYSNPGAAKGVDECDQYNNWTAYKRGNSCVDMTLPGVWSTNTLTYDYQPVCPSGTRMQWGYLTWDGQTPTYTSGGTTYQSSISFAASTTRLTPTAGGTTNYGTVAATPPSPATCPVTGVNGCPIDLYAAFGGSPHAMDDQLTLTITLTPTCDQSTTPCKGSVSPTLTSWNVSYDCIPYE